MKTASRALGYVIASASLVALAAAAAAQTKHAGREHFTAFAIDTSITAPQTKTTTVDIVIDRYSTDSERDRLLEMLDRGQDKLLDALQRLPAVGYLTTPGSIRYDIHFARQHPAADGGRNITIMTDRRISMWEAVNRPRSIDYPFTLIQLQLDKNDRGIGKASIATKITKSGDTIELENFSNEPVRLNEVRKTSD